MIESIWFRLFLIQINGNDDDHLSIMYTPRELTMITQWFDVVIVHNHLLAFE